MALLPTRASARRLTLCCLGALLLSTACKPVGDDPRAGNAALLAGDWTLTAHRTGDTSAAGTLKVTLHLIPSGAGDPSVPPTLRGGTLEGTFRIVAHGWLPGPPPDSGVSAFIASDSAVIIYLRLQGRCADCGNLGFAGKLHAGGSTGHWREELTTTAPQGSFTLER